MQRTEDIVFEPLDRPVKLRGCDCTGCAQTGDYRAPKNRESLNDYYWFCLDHVREYNHQWNYFAGLSPREIEGHIRRAEGGDRPTWPMGDWAAREQSLRDTVVRNFSSEERGFEPPPPPLPKTEREALGTLELAPPVNFATIKAAYRALVKKHHPDANSGCLEAEERFKNINQAFTVLKRVYKGEEV